MSASDRLKRRAAERAEYIITQAKRLQESFDSMGVKIAPTHDQIVRDANREVVRTRDREQWFNAILPRIIKEAELATGRDIVCL